MWSGWEGWSFSIESCDQVLANEVWAQINICSFQTMPKEEEWPLLPLPLFSFPLDGMQTWKKASWSMNMNILLWGRHSNKLEVAWISHTTERPLQPRLLTYWTVMFQFRSLGLPWWLSGKESACNAGDMGSIPGSGKSPGGGHGNPLQYSCLENPMDSRAWWASPYGCKELDVTEMI